jgi:hypothetical protein
MNLPFYQRIFADTVYSIFQPDVTAAPIDDLVLFLLRACNPSTTLIPESKKNRITILVIICTFLLFLLPLLSSHLPLSPLAFYSLPAC